MEHGVHTAIKLTHPESKKRQDIVRFDSHLVQKLLLQKPKIPGLRHLCRPPSLLQKLRNVILRLVQMRNLLLSCGLGWRVGQRRRGLRTTVISQDHLPRLLLCPVGAVGPLRLVAGAGRREQL